MAAGPIKLNEVLKVSRGPTHSVLRVRVSLSWRLSSKSRWLAPFRAYVNPQFQPNLLETEPSTSSIRLRSTGDSALCQGIGLFTCSGLVLYVGGICIARSRAQQRRGHRTDSDQCWEDERRSVIMAY